MLGTWLLFLFIQSTWRGRTNYCLLQRFHSCRPIWTILIWHTIGIVVKVERIRIQNDLALIDFSWCFFIWLHTLMLYHWVVYLWALCRFKVGCSRCRSSVLIASKEICEGFHAIVVGHLLIIISFVIQMGVVWLWERLSCSFSKGKLAVAFPN